jgi:hypothetical protein
LGYFSKWRGKRSASLWTKSGLSIDIHKRLKRIL